MYVCVKMSVCEKFLGKKYAPRRGEVAILWSRCSLYSTTQLINGPEKTRRYFSTLIPNPLSVFSTDVQLRKSGHSKLCRWYIPHPHFWLIRGYFWMLIHNPLSQFKNNAPFRRYSTHNVKSIRSHRYHAIITFICIHTYT